MEGLSTAASVVSLVAITGQLVQSTKALHDFWSSVRDVPTQLQWLSEDLNVIQGFLQQITQLSTQNPNFSGVDHIHQTLQRCAFHLSNLEALVAPLQSRSGDGRRERLWRSIKAVFNEKKIELYRENIEAAKSTLLVVQISLNRESTLAIENGVSKLLVGQPIIESDVAKLLNQQTTVESGLANLLAGQSDARDSATADHGSLLSAMSSLRHEVRMLASSPVSFSPAALAPAVETMFETTLLPALEKKMADFLSSSEGARQRQKDSVYEHYQDQTKREKRTSENSCASDTRMDLGATERRAPIARRRKRMRIYRKDISTPFGYVTFYYDVITQTRVACGLSLEERVFEFQLSVVPRPLIFRSASYIVGSWDPLLKCSLTGLNFQFRPIVSSNSAIFKACRNGDIDSMKLLFLQKQASPHDLNEEGEDLLLEALRTSPSLLDRYETCKFLLDVGCQGTATLIGGRNPLDMVMSEWIQDPNTSMEVLHSDLEIMRLLVETGRLEKIDCLWLAAVDYLCKQELFDFNLVDILCSIPIVMLSLSFRHCTMSYILTTFGAYRENAIFANARLLQRFVYSILFLHIFESFEDLKMQKEALNGTVMAFGFLLRRGFDPFTKLLDVGEPTELAAWDPDFTMVAWKLALGLNGWNALYSGSDDDSDEEADDRSEHGELASSQTPPNQGTSVTEDSTDDQRIPGAWVDEEPEDDFPIKRKFRSVPDDFDGICDGHKWDPRLYSKIED